MKKLLFIVGLIIVLLIGALIAIPMFIDPNDHKDRIVELVKKHTGRDLIITGDLKMSKFPSLGVDIGEISFGNAPGFGDQPMLKSGQASVSVKLMPLLKKDLQVSTLTLKDVFIYLAKDKSGKTNWDDLMALGGDKEAKKDSDATKLAALAIGGIDMVNANLIWDDQSLGKKYTVSNLNLKTGRLELNKPIDLKMTGNFDASAEGIAGDLALDGTIEYDLNGKKYSIKPFDFGANLKGTGIPGGAANIKLQATSAQVDLAAGTASIAGLDMDALGAKISGDIDATNIFDKIPLVDGDLKIRIDDLAKLLSVAGQDPASLPIKKINADIKLKSTADTMIIETLAATATIHGGQFKDPLDVKLNVKGDVNLANESANLTELSFEGLGATIKGNIKANKILSAIPLLNGQININAADVPALLAALGQDVSLPIKSLVIDTKLTSTADTMKVENLNAKATLVGDQIPNSPVDVTLSTTADVNLAQETLNVQNFVIKGMGLDIQGAINGTKITTNPNFNGSLKIAPFNLRELMSQMNMEAPVTADPKVLSNFGLNTNFSATKNSISLKGLAMKLDDTNISGDLAVVNFSNPAPTFNINIDSINVDRYLPPKSDDQKAVPATPETATAAATDLPMDTLRKLNAKGTLSIGSLTISNAKLKNVKLGLSAKGGKIKLNPVQANLYQGSYNGTVSLDATGSQPAIAATSSLNGVQVAPLLTDLTGDSKIDGTLIGKINITAVGAGADAIKKSLNGTTDLKFTNGALLGINIAKIIREAKAKFTGEKLAEDNTPVKTDFSELSATSTIKNGLVSNQDFLLKSPFLRVAGAGTAHLATEALDYVVKATVVGSGKGQGGEDLSDLKGIEIPVRITGTFSNMKYRPDFGGVMKAKVDQELDKQKDKVKEKVQSKLNKLLGIKAGESADGEKSDKLDLKSLLGKKLGKKEEKSAPAEAPAAEAPEEEPEKKKPEDELKDKLKGLLKF